MSSSSFSKDIFEGHPYSSPESSETDDHDVSMNYTEFTLQQPVESQLALGTSTDEVVDFDEELSGANVGIALLAHFQSQFVVTILTLS